MVYGGEYIIIAVVAVLAAILAAIYWIDRRPEPERDEYDEYVNETVEQRARKAGDD
jgi:hypothetical protein